MLHDFRVNLEKRTLGTIVKQISPSTYVVSNDKGDLVKRCVDQIDTSYEKRRTKPPAKKNARMNMPAKKNARTITPAKKNARTNFS